MKALRFHGKGDIRVEDVEEPKCGPGKVKVCQRCRMDCQWLLAHWQCRYGLYGAAFVEL